MEDNVKRIEELIRNAQAIFICWDWCRECEAGDKVVSHSDGSESIEHKYVEGEDDPHVKSCEACQQYAEDVRGAATAASDWADAAVDALYKGDLKGALLGIEEACDVEGGYGDCPAYRPAREALEALIAEEE